ncbi:atpase family aaa protein 3b [Fusarium langsethiae]|uniref:Atpase family aaa protein 3b n=1 Tax=Fusarium langsethiae TaxID=179993 RepID=A0A0M9ETL8_FUSLA|nr:atpase family aaa protein 3b [Fusarium langsethiae]
MDTSYEVDVVGGEDNISIVSFDDIHPRARSNSRSVPPPPMAPYPHMAGYPPRAISPWDNPESLYPRQETLKVNGKIPDVLHAVEYFDSRDQVIKRRQSARAFKNVPPFSRNQEEGGVDGENASDKERPVLEIITEVYPARNNRPYNRPPPPLRNQEDRPITDVFEGYGSRLDDGAIDIEREPATYAPRISQPFMNINSAHLINALKAVVAYYPKFSLEGKIVEVDSPYQVLYHHRRELAHYKDHQPWTHSPEYAAITAKHIDILLNFLDDNLGEEVRREEERHKLETPRATFDLFWLLLKPGEVFYAKRHDIWAPYVVSSVNTGKNVNNSSRDSYKVNCWMLESNGTKVNRYMHTFYLSPWLGEQEIGGLSVIPINFWPENLEAQGGRPTYMEYEGLLVNSGTTSRQSRGPTGFMSGRVICDASGFDSFYYDGPDDIRRGRYRSPVRQNNTVCPSKDYLPRNLPRCGCDACMDDRSSEDPDGPYTGFEDLDPTKDSPPESDLFYLVCSKTMPGFILGDRRWGHLNIANLKPVKTDKEAFKYLVLDDEVKMTVKALIGKFATDLGEGRVVPWGNDFVKNKGEGRIFLLHGAPGVGKTCTAECIAELTNRPLISLTSGDLSVDSYHIENNLSYFLELGQRYGALVLLDEADIYLERRRSSDIKRNGLVSVFLRALEYYRGVLFLTTNRVQSFDSAFLSRIHVALHYKNLGHEDRERIWSHNFDRLSRDSNGLVHVSSAARDFVWNSEDVRSLKWNGREIRNAMQTALALAENDAEEESTENVTICVKHLRAVVKMSRGFRDYIKHAVPIEGFEDAVVDSEEDSE